MRAHVRSITDLDQAYTPCVHLAMVAAVVAGAVEHEQRRVVPRTPHGLGEALLLRRGHHGVIARAHDQHGRQRHVAPLRQRQRRHRRRRVVVAEHVRR